MKEIKESKNESIKLKGQYKFTIAKIETRYQKWLHSRILTLREQGKQFYHLVKKLNESCKCRVYYVDNIIPTVGRTMVANNLADNTPDNEMWINYTALGDNNTPPANSDTQLGNELYRKLTASYTNASNVAYITAFYAATDCSGTYKEHGLFSDGTASANSGILFSRVLLNGGAGITKSNTETLTLDYTLTVS